MESRLFREHSSTLLVRLFGTLFFAIFVQMWHLSVVQYDVYTQRASKPTIYQSFQPSPRAAIISREGNLLAYDRPICQLAINYGAILQLPRFQKVQTAQGHFVRAPFRFQYIKRLADWLGHETQLPPQTIIDAILSKAALTPQKLFLLKTDIPYTQYYRIRTQQADWPGVITFYGFKRHYPYNTLASHVIGYLGFPTKNDLTALTQQVQTLESHLLVEENPSVYANLKAQLEQIRHHLTQNKLDEPVGKLGVEKLFDHALRGVWGSEHYKVDAVGKKRERLNHRDGSVQENLTTTLSLPLQKKAEQLLTTFLKEWQRYYATSSPNQGSVLALDPKSGDILACVSQPNFSPNSFIERQDVGCWLEDKRYIAEQWNTNSAHLFDWEKILNAIAPTQTPLIQVLRAPSMSIQKAEHTVKLFQRWARYFDNDYLQAIETLFHKEKNNPIHALEEVWPESDLIEPLKKALSVVPTEKQRLLLLDCFQMLGGKNTQTLSCHITLQQHRLWEQTFHHLTHTIKKICKKNFEETVFPKWRNAFFPELLQSIRQEERKKGYVAKPYDTFLYQWQHTLFEKWWQYYHKKKLYQALRKTAQDSIWHNAVEENKVLAQILQECIAKLGEETLAYWDTFRVFTQRKETSFLQPETDQQGLIQKLFPHQHALQSHAYASATAPGSAFKIVPALVDLLFPNKEPFVFEDRPHLQNGKWYVGTLNGKAIPQKFMGHKIPKTLKKNVGHLDTIRALTVSSNSYFALKMGHLPHGEQHLTQLAHALGWGNSFYTLPEETPGHFPQLEDDHTALYGVSIGQHALTATPLQLAVTLSYIANRGIAFRPKITQHPPILLLDKKLSQQQVQALYQGLEGVLYNQEGCGFWHKHPFSHLFASTEKLRGRFVGKTSSAERYTHQTLLATKPIKVTDMWFGGILFEDQEKTKPSLIVVVKIPNGTFGKMVIPIATELALYWDELNKQQHTEDGPLGRVE